MEQAPKSPTPFDREAHKSILEKGLAFLQTVEAEYRAGIRNEREVIFFANKVQGLLFDAYHEDTESYDAHARLTKEEGVYYTELHTNYPTPETEVVTETAPENLESLSEYCTKLKTTLSSVLQTYRSSFSTQTSYISAAQEVLQNQNALPSEILSTTQLLISQLYK